MMQQKNENSLEMLMIPTFQFPKTLFWIDPIIYIRVSDDRGNETYSASRCWLGSDIKALLLPAF